MTRSAPDKPGFGRRGELLVAIQFALLFAFILLPVWRPGVSADLLDATWPFRVAIGIAMGVIALILGGLGSHHIRDYLTPLPYPVDHSQLVQHGVYAVVRHPLYASQLFAAFGYVIYQLSLSHLLLLAVGFLFFNYKAGKEEGWLTERHPEYADYARRVRKFIPWIY
jgi:protein-S-isoprenylcysteine O-methyltransferase Ste14